MKNKITAFINDAIEEVRNYNTRTLNKSLYPIIAVMFIYYGFYMTGRLIGKATAKYQLEMNKSR